MGDLHNSLSNIWQAQKICNSFAGLTHMVEQLVEALKSASEDKPYTSPSISIPESAADIEVRELQAQYYKVCDHC